MEQINQSRTEICYNILLQKILLLELLPGSYIDIGTLAKELKMSTTPLKSALRKIEDMKLVHILPRKGIYIAPLEIKELFDIFELRLVLMGFSGRLAAERITDEQLKQIEILLQSMQQLIDGPDNKKTLQEFFKIDKQIHDLIDTATNNEMLKEFNERSYLRSCRLWLQFKEDMAPMDIIFGELQGIYEALKNHDPALAERRCRDHLMLSIELIKSKFTQFSQEGKMLGL